MSNVAAVFSGGGGKGSYQIGVWKALDEFGITPHVSTIAGTSVGSLNAILFKQGNWDLAERLWCSLTPEDILTESKARAALMRGVDLLTTFGLPTAASFILYLARRGLCTRDGLKRIGDKYIDWDCVGSRGIEVSATALESFRHNLKHFRLQGTNRERALSILLASSAIPVVFPPEQIDDKNYIDGGVLPFVSMNTPVPAVLHKNPELIITVLLSRDDFFDPSQYPDQQIIPIFPRENLGELTDGALDFDGKNASRRIIQGYEDTVRVLEPIFRAGRAELEFQKTIKIAQQQQQEWKHTQREVEANMKELKMVVENSQAITESSSAEIREATQRINRL